MDSAALCEERGCHSLSLHPMSHSHTHPHSYSYSYSNSYSLVTLLLAYFEQTHTSEDCIKYPGHQRRNIQVRNMVCDIDMVNSINGTKWEGGLRVQPGTILCSKRKIKAKDNNHVPSPTPPSLCGSLQPVLDQCSAVQEWMSKAWPCGSHTSGKK